MTPSKPEALSPAVAQRRGRYGYFMYLRGDQYVGRSLELYGEFSEGEVALFRQVVPAGGVVFEGGANIGALTVPLARIVGPQGRVIAVEPQRAVYNVLCGNVALNGLVNVEAERCALGAEAGEISVPVLGYGEAANYGGISLDDVGLTVSEEVPMRTVDSFDLDRLHLLKLDVEGFEEQVLSGAEATLNKHRPVVFVENDRQQKSPALIQQLLDMDYKLWWHITPLFNPNNYHGNPDNQIGNYVSVNMLGLPNEKTTEVNGLREINSPDDWWK